MHQPYDWERESEFSPEQPTHIGNVVRLEDFRAVRDQLSGRDTDDESMILPRRLGLDKELSAPELTVINGGGKENSTSVRELALSYSPFFIMGGIATGEILRRLF